MKELRAQAQDRWQALSPREQRGVSVLGALLGVLLFWSIALAPALNTLRDSDNRRAQISQQQAVNFIVDKLRFLNSSYYFFA